MFLYNSKSYIRGFQLIFLQCAISILSLAQPSGLPDFEGMAQSEIRNSLKIPASPEATSFTKYGEFDVSYYTGAVNINIPLYTIGDDKMNWGFSLSFDASGVRP